MKLWRRVFLCLLSVAMFMTAGSSFAADTDIISKIEERETQQAAKLFVKRMQETRDITPLIDEMFLPNFISHFESGDESMPPSLYLRLTHAERLRLFVIQSNATYLMTLDAICRPEGNFSEEERYKAAFTNIFPSAMAEKLRNTVWRGNEFHFSSYTDFQTRLPEIERVLSEARAYLISQNIEQTSEFQRKLDDTVRGEGIKYRVRAYIGGDKIKDCEPLVDFPANQKFFRVETPLLMGVILVKDGNKMKIVRLTYADED